MDKMQCLEMTIESLETVINQKDKYIQGLLQAFRLKELQLQKVAKSYLKAEKEIEILESLLNARLSNEKDMIDVETTIKENVIDEVIKRLEEL